MKSHRTAIALLTIAVGVLSLTLFLTVAELRDSRKILKEAQIQADTIYRGTALAAEFCEKMIEEAKCKSL